jgi:signal transduction histidine kinase
MIAQRFLMGLPAATWHRVSAGVGAILALLVTWVSVRVIERQQRELAKLARLKEELTQMVVHDLRTPLAAMIGSLETVRAGVVGEVSAGAAEMTEIALEGSQSLCLPGSGSRSASWLPGRTAARSPSRAKWARDRRSSWRSRQRLRLPSPFRRGRWIDRMGQTARWHRL